MCWPLGGERCKETLTLTSLSGRTDAICPKTSPEDASRSSLDSGDRRLYLTHEDMAQWCGERSRQYTELSPAHIALKPNGTELRFYA